MDLLHHEARPPHHRKQHQHEPREHACAVPRVRNGTNKPASDRFNHARVSFAAIVAGANPKS